MWHVIEVSGQEHVLPTPADKDVAVALMRAFFAMRRIQRYVFIDEAWMVVARDENESRARRLDEWKTRGIADHPDRQEIVLFSAEDADLGMITAHRVIERPPGAIPILAPSRSLKTSAAPSRAAWSACCRAFTSKKIDVKNRTRLQRSIRLALYAGSDAVSSRAASALSTVHKNRLTSANHRRCVEGMISSRVEVGAVVKIRVQQFCSAGDTPW
jgi:hypothetical protein